MRMNNPPSRTYRRHKRKIACRYCNARHIKCKLPDRDQVANEVRSGRQCQACLDANEECDLDREADSPTQREHLPRKKAQLNQLSPQIPPARSTHQISLQRAAADDSRSLWVRGTPGLEDSEMLLVRFVDVDEGDVADGSKEGDHKVMYFGNDSIWSYSLQKARRTKSLNSASPASVDGQSAQNNVHHPVSGAMDSTTDARVNLFTDNEASATLRKSGAFNLPPIETQRELLDAYFRWHYPLQPILDKDDFIRDFETGRVSILLLQALFSVAITCCDESVVQKHWLDRRSAQAAFYRHARALYDADHEQSRVTVVQALFFVCHWWGSPTDIKDFSHWLSASIHLAQGMGMHRS